jgi:hypothetical protein
VGLFLKDWAGAASRAVPVGRAGGSAGDVGTSFGFGTCAVPSAEPGEFEGEAAAMLASFLGTFTEA